MGLNRMIRRELPGKGVAVRRKGRHTTVFKVLKARRNGKGRPANDGVTMGELHPDAGKLIPDENRRECREAPA